MPLTHQCISQISLIRAHNFFYTIGAPNEVRESMESVKLRYNYLIKSHANNYERLKDSNIAFCVEQRVPWDTITRFPKI